ncbi:hypothetical protein PMI42_05007, partial [Bradyrhizobium sp. YR681]
MPGLSRASTSCLMEENVDGRD